MVESSAEEWPVGCTCGGGFSPYSLVADSAGLGLLAGHGIVLFGEFLNGEHSSVPSRLPWAVIYTHPESLAGGGGAVHPAGGYEMIWDLAVAAILWRWASIAPPGVLFWASVTLFSLGRLGARLFPKRRSVFAHSASDSVIRVARSGDRPGVPDVYLVQGRACC